MDDCAQCQGNPVAEVRVKTFSNGSKQYCQQCIECGQRVSTWLAKTHPLVLAITDRIPFDEAAEQAFRDRRHATWTQEIQQRQEERRAEIERQNTERANFAAKQDAAWWQWYNTYLRSAAWRSIRQRVMDRANGMCEGCAANYATQVHHLTYAHVGNEFLWELVAVCDSCHTRYHAESESRNAA